MKRTCHSNSPPRRNTNLNKMTSVFHNFAIDNIDPRIAGLRSAPIVL